MDSSGTSGNISEPPSSKGATILGTLIAVLTLALPLWIIASYSNFEDSIVPLPQTIYSLPEQTN
jgi:hypothetical protein